MAGTSGPEICYNKQNFALRKGNDIEYDYHRILTRTVHKKFNKSDFNGSESQGAQSGDELIDKSTKNTESAL